ncbi:hypothetical protein [Nonomuraea sp. NPDC003709]|uniref:hypothetical protein n=1 Tax=Nonomuraea sp. NPDC003709 TaxID=3154450 RepID=UPI0033BE27B2
MAFPDWGSVPAWLGAGSLLLAFRIFLRDRANADRGQVDKVGAWCELTHSPPTDDQQHDSTVKIKLFLRNGNELPVQVVRTAVMVRTPCLGSASPNLGYDRVRTVRWGLVSVAPLVTWESEAVSIPISEEERSALRERPDESACWIRWTLVIDNAGRVWETRHIKGKQARRLRWWSRQRQEYPLAWLYPKPVTVLARLNPNFRRWLRAHEGISLPRVTIDE